MGILDRVREVVGRDDPARPGDVTYTYQCRDCEATFESGDPNTARVSCPECSGTRVRGPVSA